MLSIGRIFHKLTLSENTVTVTRYWPKHPYPQKENHYTYRFQVPDSDSYDVSWTTFCGEELENYNWNFVDHYICSRGEGDFRCEVTSKKHGPKVETLSPQRNEKCQVQKNIFVLFFSLSSTGALATSFFPATILPQRKS